MKTIDDETRRKIFGLLKAAHEADSSPLSMEDYRYMQQSEVGISSLRDCPADLALKLMNRLHRIIERQNTQQGMPNSEVRKKKGPAGGRPKWPLEWTGERKAQLEKVEALCADMGLPWDYADSIAKRMFGDSVLRVDTLDRNQLRAVITALVRRQKNHGGRRTEVRNG